MRENARVYEVERGDEMVLSSIRPADDEWLEPHAAAKILCVTLGTLRGTFGPSNDYWQVRRILRGTNGKMSARGQGHLFHIDDLRRIAKIRATVRCSLVAAARFFAAQSLGNI